MQRACFTFEIYEHMADEYKRRHDEIWPELVELIQDSGLKNYTLFRRGTQVIAYVEAHPDLETAFAGIADSRDQRSLVQVVRGGHREPHRLRRQPLLRRRGLAPRLSEDIGAVRPRDSHPPSTPPSALSVRNSAALDGKIAHRRCPGSPPASALSSNPCASGSTPTTGE